MCDLGGVFRQECRKVELGMRHDDQPGLLQAFL